MSKRILGLDLGTNSVGWALFEGNQRLIPTKLIDLGVRIFPKSVEAKTLTPKNQERRNARLARRIIQRRSRRKQRMLKYLILLDLLPEELKSSTQPEIILNAIGDPYELRTRGLDQKLSRHEIGRLLLHLVQRRGFQSNRKTLLGDMIDDPDVISELSDNEETSNDKDETEFKKDIAILKSKIAEEGYRSLGEYLHHLPKGLVKRNRNREGGHLRTDRQMYKDEFWLLMEQQKLYYPALEDAQEELFQIIFFQRPLKLKKDRVGKCTLEKNKTRAKKAWQLFQRFRYLQDINSLRYFDSYTSQWNELNIDDKNKLIELFEQDPKPTITKIKAKLGHSKNQKYNFDSATNKSFKGNLTALAIKQVYPSWDNLNKEKQNQLEEDLITYESKKALKQRLINYWGLSEKTAINLCVIEFEPEHSDLSLKAIRKLLPFLEKGQIYSDARISAGYGYEAKQATAQEKLLLPPDIPNPIVMKGLHELKRVINAVIKEYGKPDAIRLEMARDLEMNTKRYKAFTRQQTKNTKLNEEAQEQFSTIAKKNAHLGLSQYASHSDKLKYRLWKEQECRCAYSNQTINLTELFTSAIEVDHIIPYSLSMDDSYMNKVVCYAAENQFKGQKTPREAFENDAEKWSQIEGSISHWYQKGLSNKRNAFYKTADDLDQNFANSQLTDTRYISREALHYIKTLGVDVNTVKGQVTSWLRHRWGMNSCFDDNISIKDRTDHRHHAIDAAVIACIDRNLYNNIIKTAKKLENQPGSLNIKDLPLDYCFDEYRQQVKERLNKIIIAHTPERKLTGALHEDTGLGFIEGAGTVYRKNLDASITPNAINNIIDPVVKNLVIEHLEKHNGSIKQAFNQANPVFHKDGKTPIKRVRVTQSKTTLKALKENKLGIKNKQGKIFKWMTLGNTHHVEIFHHKKSNKYQTPFITTLKATKRVHNNKAIINTCPESGWEFCFALHKNELVIATVNGQEKIYRVQKLDASSNRIMLRHHLASTLNNKSQELNKRVSILLNEHKLYKININAIGKITND